MWKERQENTVVQSDFSLFQVGKQCPETHSSALQKAHDTLATESPSQGSFWARGIPLKSDIGVSMGLFAPYGNLFALLFFILTT